MLRRLVGAGLVGALVLTGCGGDGGGGNAASPSATSASETGSPSATPTPVAEAQLKTALLVASDLPAGWIADPDEAGDEDEDDAPKECPQLDDADDLLGDAPEASASFAKGDSGPFFSEEVASAATEAEITAALQAFDKALASCPSFTTTEDGTTMTAKIAPLRLGEIGDESVAYRMTVTFDGGNYVVDTVASRVRTYGVIVIGTSVKSSGGGGTLTTAELEALARKAVEKVSTTLP